MTLRTKILTCQQIRLDCQSHYAHKDVVTTEIVVPSPDFSQLRDQQKRSVFSDRRQQASGSHVLT